MNHLRPGDDVPCLVKSLMLARKPKKRQTSLFTHHNEDEHGVIVCGGEDLARLTEHSGHYCTITNNIGELPLDFPKKKPTEETQEAEEDDEKWSDDQAQGVHGLW